MLRAIKLKNKSKIECKSSYGNRYGLILGTGQLIFFGMIGRNCNNLSSTLNVGVLETAVLGAGSQTV